MSEDVKLDWASAEVQDGRLVIALDRKPKKDWKEAFKRTTRLLNHGAWDEVALKRGTVSVQPVRPGDEGRLRHFLESVVLQANTAVGTGKEAETAPDDSQRPEDDGAREDADDHRMTQRLRSFAQADAGD